jgi:hypothetical protein
VCGGTLTTTAPTGIALTGATINAGSQCVFSVTVTGGAVGTYVNTTSNVTSTNGGTGNNATATLGIGNTTGIATAFGAATLPLNGTTSLTFTLNNPNASLAASAVAFTDALPAGLLVATPSGASNTCGGTLTATSGSASVTFTGGTIAANASCTISVNVLGSAAGAKNNSVQVSSSFGAGNTASASITVVAPPLISKAFGATSIALNTTTTLSFTIQNTNNAATTLTGVGFTDTFPAGLVIDTPNGLSGSCGGGTITATAGAATVTLAGASLAAAASCTFSVNVKGVAGGNQTNVTGNVSSVEGGAGGTATATLLVQGNTFTGPLPSGAGFATASFTGGGASCGYSRAAFIPATGAPSSPPPFAGYTFPLDLFDFATSGCTPGSTLAFTITYPSAVPAGAKYLKYGPTADNTAPHWYQLPATISGNTATFSITDGGLGDDDLAANGGIVDQGGPGVPGSPATAQVPTLSEWAMAILAAMLAMSAWLVMRRRGSR